MGFKLNFVRYLFLSVIILSVGCAASKNLREENLSVSQGIQEPGGEPEGVESAKRDLEEQLQGSGVTTRVKDGKIAIALPSAVFFNSGQVILKKKAESSLARVGNAIKAVFPNGTIRIEGHTDSDPIRKTRHLYASNWELSAMRAASVLRFLTSKCNLSPDRLYVAGFGEYQPVASNNTKEGKKQNRRVEIVILTTR
ncbi:MAG: OmpA/MotB family protein [Candidatus Brocadiales bacterium]